MLIQYLPYKVMLSLKWNMYLILSIESGIICSQNTVYFSWIFSKYSKSFPQLYYHTGGKKRKSNIWHRYIESRLNAIIWTKILKADNHGFEFQILRLSVEQSWTSDSSSLRLSFLISNLYKVNILHRFATRVHSKCLIRPGTQLV